MKVGVIKGRRQILYQDNGVANQKRRDKVCKVGVVKGASATFSKQRVCGQGCGS